MQFQLPRRPMRPTCRIRRRPMALAIVVVAALPALAAEQPPARKVVETGDATAGLASGELRVFGSRDVLSISADGKTVLFDGASPRGTLFAVNEDGTNRVLLEQFASAPSGTPANPAGFIVANPQRAVLSRTGSVAMEPVFQDALDRTRVSAAMVTDIAGATATRAATGFPFLASCSLRALAGTAWAFNGDTLVFRGTLECDRPDTAIFRLLGDGTIETLLLGQGGFPAVPGADRAGSSSFPIVHESGATLFTLAYDNPFTETALVGVPAPGVAGDPVYIRGTESSSPGGAVDGFAPVGFVFGAEQNGVSRLPRHGYVARMPNGLGAVFDSAAGLSPVMQSGAESDGKTLNVGIDRRVGLALCDGGQVVVVASTSGPGTFGGSRADGIWRYDPDENGGLPTLELFEGQELSTPDGRTLRIQDLFTVHVNEAGRVAAEVRFVGSLGIQAIVWQETPGGPYTVPVISRDVRGLPGQLDADGGPYKVIQFINRVPTTFAFTGPGHDGRQSRFNARGEFVFRMRFDTAANGADRDGVFVLGSAAGGGGEEPAPTDANVAAKVKAGVLFLQGGANADAMEAVIQADGSFVVTGLNGTTVNGAAAPFTGRAPKGIKARMGAGDDVLRLRGATDCVNPASHEGVCDWGGRLFIGMEAGSDVLTLDDLAVASVAYDPGRRDGAPSDRDEWTSAGCEFGRLKTSNSAGRVEIELRDCVVRGRSKFLLGAADGSRCTATGTTFLSSVSVKGGRGSGSCSLASTAIAGKTRIDGGRAPEFTFSAGNTTIDQTMISMRRVEQVNVEWLTSVSTRRFDVKWRTGSIRVGLGKRSEEAAAIAASLEIDASAGQSVLSLWNGTFGGDVVHRGTGGNQTLTTTLTSYRGFKSACKGSATDVAVSECSFRGGFSLSSSAPTTCTLDRVTAPSATFSTGDGDADIEITGAEIAAIQWQARNGTNRLRIEDSKFDDTVFRGGDGRDVFEVARILGLHNFAAATFFGRDGGDLVRLEMDMANTKADLRMGGDDDDIVIVRNGAGRLEVVAWQDRHKFDGGAGEDTFESDLTEEQLEELELKSVLKDIEQKIIAIAKR